MCFRQHVYTENLFKTCTTPCVCCPNAFYCKAMSVGGHPQISALKLVGRMLTDGIVMKL